MSTEQQAVRNSVSRLFQTTGPDTEKSCVPSAVDVLAVSVSELADSSCCLPTTDTNGKQSSARQESALQLPVDWYSLPIIVSTYHWVHRLLHYQSQDLMNFAKPQLC